MKGISIIICCYNSAKCLHHTLAHIAKQQVGVEWELILVNNNSTDNTAALADEIWESLGAPVSLKVVDEIQAGLSHAREKGMQEAKYDLFLWCDDDNWLSVTYVQTAFDIMKTHPDISALRGWCEATFETEKPEWFDKQARFFAVSNQRKYSGYITQKKSCVYGAGMHLMLRNQVF